MSTQDNINEIAKVIRKAMTAQEAASRGLVPQSGNPDKPGRWIKDPKADDKSKDKGSSSGMSEADVRTAIEQAKQDAVRESRMVNGHRNRATWSVSVLDLLPDENLREQLEDMDRSTMTRQEAKFALADSAKSMLEEEFEMAEDALRDSGFGWMTDFINTHDIDYDSLVEHHVDEFDDFKDDIEERESEASTVYRREQD